MRVLLDAQVSGPVVGRRLEAGGHDVSALDQDPQLEGLPDEEVLDLATADRRILVTHNISDFPRILREWAVEARSHAGVILVYGIGHAEFGLVVRGIERWLAMRPAAEEWVDLSVILDRNMASR